MITLDQFSSIAIEQRGQFVAGSFTAMAGPCEVLIETQDKNLATRLTTIAAEEAWRIEAKYSRYRKDSALSQINSSDGQPIKVDEETAGLINFAFQVYHISEGMFDITSGILRRLWPFGSNFNLPKADQVNALCQHIGLDKVNWQPPIIQLATGMELDFGGIGKEYAVDRALDLITRMSDLPVLVNFGGDIAANRPPLTQPVWQIKIETPPAKPSQLSIDSNRDGHFTVELKRGGLATSGDTKRYIIQDGKKYGHILNPLTGWPVSSAPQSVTVAAPNCVEAGLYSTLAMLHGTRAEEFLQQQDVVYHVFR